VGSQTPKGSPRNLLHKHVLPVPVSPIIIVLTDSGTHHARSFSIKNKFRVDNVIEINLLNNEFFMFNSLLSLHLSYHCFYNLSRKKWRLQNNRNLILFSFLKFIRISSITDKWLVLGQAYYTIDKNGL
jgi:hypothetical protein